MSPEGLLLEASHVEEDVVVKPSPVGGDVAETAHVASKGVGVALEVLVVVPFHK